MKPIEGILAVDKPKELSELGPKGMLPWQIEVAGEELLKKISG